MKITIAGRTVPVIKWDRSMPVIDSGPEDMIGLDTETEPIQGKVDFPPVVLGQFCNGVICHLVPWQDMPYYMEEVNKANPTAVWTFHNLPFDSGVTGHLPWMLQKVDEGKVIDVGIRWQLRDIARIGSMRSEEYPALDDVTWDVLKYSLNKETSIRMGFRQDKEPDEASCKYAAEDALATWMCAYTMQKQGTEDYQVKCMIPLDTISRNGMLVDQDNFTALSQKLTDEYQEVGQSLQDKWDLPIGKNKDLNGPQMLGQLGETINLLFVGEKKDVSVGIASYMTFLALQNIDDPYFGNSVTQAYSDCLDPEFSKAVNKNRKDYDTFIANTLGVTPPVNAKNEVVLTKKTLLHILYRIVRYRYEGLSGTDVKNRIYVEYTECLGWSSEYKQKGIETVMQAILHDVEVAMEVTFTRTATGKIATNEEAMGKYDVDHPFLNDYKRYKHLEKMIGTYLNWDLVEPDGRVHPRFMYMVRTGRTSCRRPNMQNLPREQGMREVYKAPAGHVLVSIDYSQLELCTLAQDCYIRFGKSRLGDMINAGIDVHAYLGGRLYDLITEEIDINKPEEVEKLRTLIAKLKEDKAFKDGPRAFAKVANFGFPGGLGAKTFIPYAKGYGLTVTMEEAIKARNEWLRTFPEMELHLVATPMSTTLEEEEKLAKDGEREKYTVTTYTGRKRNNTTFTAALNTKFQGTAADGAKLVMWELYKRGPVYKIVDFIHDEFILELPYDEFLTARIKHIQSIMEVNMKRVVPQVKIQTEAAVMFNWSKKADAYFDTEGNYIPWELSEEYKAA